MYRRWHLHTLYIFLFHKFSLRYTLLHLQTRNRELQKTSPPHQNFKERYMFRWSQNVYIINNVLSSLPGFDSDSLNLSAMLTDKDFLCGNLWAPHKFSLTTVLIQSVSFFLSFLTLPMLLDFTRHQAHQYQSLLKRPQWFKQLLCQISQPF